MAHSTSGTAVRVLCYGDSLTAGYCGFPNSYCPYAKQLSQKLSVAVDHVGLSGWRAEEMVANLSNGYCVDIFHNFGPGLAVQLAQQKYSYCILMAGTNDLGVPRSADEILNDLKRLHQYCHSRGVRTIALSIPESQFIAQNGWSREAMVRQQVNQGLSAWAATQAKKMLFIDMASHLPYSLFTGDWAADGLHLTHQGYTRFGHQLAKLLRQHLTASPATSKKAPLADTTNISAASSKATTTTTTSTPATTAPAVSGHTTSSKGPGVAKAKTSSAKPMATTPAMFSPMPDYSAGLSSWGLGDFFYSSSGKLSTMQVGGAGTAKTSPPVTTLPFTETSSFLPWSVMPQVVM